MTRKASSRKSKTIADESLATRWQHIEQLIDYGGDVTLGAVSRDICAVTASDQAQCLAMLQRRDGETLVDMLDRLDAAIASAWDDGEFIDEINPP
jgi:hypothetical protein